MEEVEPLRVVGFEVFKAHARPSSLSLPADQDVELSATSLAPYLPECPHASHCDDNGLNL